MKSKTCWEVVEIPLQLVASQIRRTSSGRTGGVAMIVWKLGCPQLGLSGAHGDQSSISIFCLSLIDFFGGGI